MSSPISKASVVVAMSLGAVEALKDQAGLCRWNYALRSLHHHANNHLRSASQATSLSSSSSSSSSSSVDRRKDAEMIHHEMKAKKLEKTMDRVVYLSCWGPN